MSSRMLSPRCAFVLLLACASSRALSGRRAPFRCRLRQPPAGMLEPVPEALADLATLQQVRLVDVPLPGGALVSLDLQRVPVAAQGAALQVNGAVAPGALDAGVSLWSGRVAGEPGSEAFLAFSRHGSRGWVRSGGQLLHLLARPGADGAWGSSVSSWASESELRAAGARPPLQCAAMDVAGRSAPSLPRPAGAEAATADGSVLPILECHMVVESDWQFYQHFGDLDAARTYALELLGAVSDRYREQLGVILTIPFLELWTTSADPWTAPDTGDTLALLYEFQTAWGPGFGGSPPVVGDEYHFLSGAYIGGGVAYLPGLCDQDYGFAVSANLAGLTPFPIAVGPLNWDFVVVAHEIGPQLRRAAHARLLPAARRVRARRLLRRVPDAAGVHRTRARS